jgi:hypothetical protein
VFCPQQWSAGYTGSDSPARNFTSCKEMLSPTSSPWQFSGRLLNSAISLSVPFHFPEAGPAVYARRPSNREGICRGRDLSCCINEPFEPLLAMENRRPHGYVVIPSPMLSSGGCQP